MQKYTLDYLRYEGWFAFPYLNRNERQEVYLADDVDARIAKLEAQLNQAWERIGYYLAEASDPATCQEAKP